MNISHLFHFKTLSSPRCLIPTTTARIWRVVAQSEDESAVAYPWFQLLVRVSRSGQLSFPSFRSFQMYRIIKFNSAKFNFFNESVQIFDFILWSVLNSRLLGSGFPPRPTELSMTSWIYLVLYSTFYNLDYRQFMYNLFILHLKFCKNH